MNYKLDKLQRHTAYIILLAELKKKITEDSHTYWGICELSYKFFAIDPDNDGRFRNMKLYYPELWERRDGGREEHSMWLWNNNTNRVIALQKSIKETA